jgi:prepilin-type N-terminal cleavage/methylation domain-containing protein
MQDRKNTGQRGASLLEILIVLAIVGVIVTIAVIKMSGANKNMERQNIAREFKVDLERARFDSVKRRANSCYNMSRVTINDATSFSTTTDMNQNGTLETAETQNYAFPGSGVTIIGNGITLPVTIRFDERGHAVLTDCVSIPPPNVPLFYFCNGTCTTLTANSQNSNVIFVSPSGTVAMLTGGQTMPTFGNPSVTNVNSNTQINPLLAVWDPFSPTPTATATNTPTPTPTAAATPTYTPTPYYCHVGSPWQNPAQDGCICQAPQWVRSNGQCK